MWQSDIPAGSALSFTSRAQVDAYFGTGSPEDRLARGYFRGAGKDDAVMYLTRLALGQRPHLLGANLDNLPPIGGDSGSLQINFNGWQYGVNNLLTIPTNAPITTEALAIQSELNLNRQVVAQTTGDTITPQSIGFLGTFQSAQLTVDSLSDPNQPLVIGGIVNGAGVTHPMPTSNEVIEFHAGATGGPGSYGCFNWSHTNISTEQAFTESYGLLHVNSTTSGQVQVGCQVSGPGVAPDTAIVGQVDANDWIVNNAQQISGDFTVRSPFLTVAAKVESPTNSLFEIQPNGAFCFDSNPSTLNYATGTLADALGLTQASGAILASPGGQHITINQFMNNTLLYQDQNGNSINFGSYQINETRLQTQMAEWATTPAGQSYTFYSNIYGTPPAG
jgi:hypothetical protein